MHVSIFLYFYVYIEKFIIITLYLGLSQGFWIWCRTFVTDRIHNTTIAICSDMLTNWANWLWIWVVLATYCLCLSQQKDPYICLHIYINITFMSFQSNMLSNSTFWPYVYLHGLQWWWVQISLWSTFYHLQKH